MKMIPSHFICPHCDVMTTETFIIQSHLKSKHGYGKRVKTYTSDELVQNTDVEEVSYICEYE